jgi:hypothetical protein
VFACTCKNIANSGIELAVANLSDENSLFHVLGAHARADFGSDQSISITIFFGNKVGTALGIVCHQNSGCA